MDTNLEEQQNELLAISSILDSSLTMLANSCGEIKIHPTLQQSTIKIIPACLNQNGSESSSTEAQEYAVQFLPPITLNFSYPSSYPSESPPEYTLSCSWLSRYQLNSLCDELDKIWSEQFGNVVLFSWHQFLEDESLLHLEIDDTLNLGRELCTEKLSASSSNNAGAVVQSSVKNQNKVVQNVRNTAEILPLILTYDQTKREEVFKVSTFTCDICFESKIGDNCMQFTGCDHVYCKDCIGSYFSIQIKDGSVKSMECPAENCHSQPLPIKVQELVDPSLYERYEKLLLQTTLDTMEDVTYCPLIHCQYPVTVDPKSNIALCPSCRYAFCPFCKLSYHGVSKCKIASKEIRELCDRYKSAGQEEKLFMEKKYGKKVLNTAIEESETQAWMANNTKECPSCGANIEKIDGCNKMTCYKCRSYFCWICFQLLDKVNPYKHFNNPNSSCFNQLFAGVDFDDDFDLWF